MMRAKVTRRLIPLCFVPLAAIYLAVLFLITANLDILKILTVAEDKYE